MAASQESVDHWSNPTERRCYRALAQLSLDFFAQYSIGRYRADAFLPKHNVILEFDDYSHNYKLEQDEERDTFMAQLGYYTLRITYKALRKDTLTALKESLERVGIPTRVRLGHCTLSVEEIVTIEVRQRMYLCGYVESANMLFPVFRHRSNTHDL